MAKKNYKKNIRDGKENKNVSSIVKEDKIEVEGKVIEVIKGGDYLVSLPNGHTVEAYVSGKMRVHMIRILPGDTVTIELSPYDLTRGRITWNKR
jgi:translation initiation factor IF-1